jgi:hypothetical protein
MIDGRMTNLMKISKKERINAKITGLKKMTDKMIDKIIDKIENPNSNRKKDSLTRENDSYLYHIFILFLYSL